MFLFGPLAPLTFQGDVQRRHYYDWLQEFPGKSRLKIQAIYRAAKSPKTPPRVSHNVKHIVMAIKGALLDSWIFSLVKTLVQLHKNAYWARKADAHPGQTSTDEKKTLALKRKMAEEELQDLHVALDWFCGNTTPFTLPPEGLPLAEEGSVSPK